MIENEKKRLTRVKHADAALRVAPELETKHDSAHALGVGLRTVDRLVKKKTLDSVQMGRRRLIKVASRRALAAKGTVEIADEADKPKNR
jgi:excisionase family DNA binding protein